MKNNNLTLKSLSNILNSLLETGIIEDKLIEIPLQDEALGVTKSTTLAACSIGFDWDSGRIFLYTKDPLVSHSYLQECLYGNWHPYPKFKPHRAGNYWVTIDDGDKPFVTTMETLKKHDTSGKYSFYCTKKIIAWKELIIPKPYYEANL